MKSTQPSPTIAAAPAQLVPLRTPSGHLIGYYDARRGVLQVKRGGRPIEEIDLRPLISASNP